MTLTIKRMLDGDPIEYKGARSHRRRTATVDSLWYVYDAKGRYVGRVAHVMRTRERRSRGRTYVDARWQSPAWIYDYGFGDPEPAFVTPHFRGLEASSRADAVGRMSWRLGER